MLEKEFVPFEEALELKELEFDEPCVAFYEQSKRLSIGFNWLNEGGKNSNLQECTAPTYSQAFRWFREKYGLHQYIQQYCGERFYFYIEDMIHPRRYEEYLIENLRNFGEYTSHEEAELACLRKLIEIVKTKK